MQHNIDLGLQISRGLLPHIVGLKIPKATETYPRTKP